MHMVVTLVLQHEITIHATLEALVLQGLAEVSHHLRPKYIAHWHQFFDCGLIIAAARLHYATNTPTELELHRSPPTIQPCLAG